ncbi:MAG: helix-turn-helix domain containing protein [Chloroflexi bacterium]|nr:helix-turn-helix domain containing protein [Chloroflexota bacterium]
MPKLIFARPLLPDERRELVRMAESSDPTMRARAKVILYSAEERYRVPEIALLVGLGPDKVRKWIHRFNTQGLRGLKNRAYKPGPPPRFRGMTRKKIIEIAQTPPRTLGLLFSTWTLHSLRRYLIEQGIVDHISHETLRKILKEANVDWRKHGVRKYG